MTLTNLDNLDKTGKLKNEQMASSYALTRPHHSMPQQLTQK